MSTFVATAAKHVLMKLLSCVHNTLFPTILHEYNLRIHYICPQPMKLPRLRTKYYFRFSPACASWGL